jgi:hypothetical protein
MRLKSSRWTKRTGLLVMLTLIVLAFTAHARPAKAALSCCNLDTKGTTNYYSNASKTVLVGRYTWNDCTGTESLTGQQTQYVTSFISCCSTC